MFLKLIWFYYLWLVFFIIIIKFWYVFDVSDLLIWVLKGIMVKIVFLDGEVVLFWISYDLDVLLFEVDEVFFDNCKDSVLLIVVINKIVGVGLVVLVVGLLIFYFGG